MAHELSIPAIGESVTEGTIGRWLVDDGAWVEEGAPLYELETDKVSSEVAAEVGGILHIEASEGESLPVGSRIGSIDVDAAKPGDAAQAKPTDEAPAGGASPARPATAADSARRDDDVSDAKARLGEADGAPESATKASPAARKLLAEHELEHAAVSGSGRHGSITKADVLAHLKKPSQPTPTPSPEPRPSEATETKRSDEAGVSRRPMSPLRKRIASRLVQAQQTAAILTTFNEIDMAQCMQLRQRYKDAFAEKHQTGLGFMSFFTTATVRALQAYPLLGSRIDGDDLVIPEHVHMGIAIGTERGLVVPVLRHAEQMRFSDIEKAIRAYASRARDGKLSIEDMQGGTFTITNGGVYGSLLSTPILNPPQAGILGMHAIKDRPMAIDGEVVIRPMMYVALSYDHRIVDGAEAVGFLVRIKELIEAPERLLFDL